LSLSEQLEYIKENMPEAYEKIVSDTLKSTGKPTLPVFNDDDEIVGYSTV